MRGKKSPRKGCCSKEFNKFDQMFKLVTNTKLHCFNATILCHQNRRCFSSQTGIGRVDDEIEIPEMTVVQQISYGSAWDSFRTTKVLRPEPIGNEVLIEISHASVNPIDIWVRNGYGKQSLESQRQPPFIPGRDCSGKVVAVGPLTMNFKIGDKVYGAISPTSSSGCYGEFVCMNEHYIAKKPKNLSFKESASLPFIALTGYEALVNVAQVKSHHSVLLLGAGGSIGTFLLQYLKNVIGCNLVSGTCGTEDVPLISELGATEVFDYKKNEQPSNKYDIVVDLVGGKTKLQGTEYVKHGGHFVTANGDLVRRMDSRGIIPGLISGATELYSEKLVRAASENMSYDWIYFKANGRALSHITEAIEQHKIKPFVDGQEFSLFEVPLAHEHVEKKKNRGKVVISVYKNVMV